MNYNSTHHDDVMLTCHCKYICTLPFLRLSQPWRTQLSNRGDHRWSIPLTWLDFCMFVSSTAGHRQQDDVFKPGHHIWPEPAPQAEELRQRVQRPELGQSWGEHGRHRGAAEADCQLPDPLHGQSLSLFHFTSSFDSFTPQGNTHTHTHTYEHYQQGTVFQRERRDRNKQKKESNVSESSTKSEWGVFLKILPEFVVVQEVHSLPVSWQLHQKPFIQTLELYLSKIKAENSCLKSSAQCQKRSHITASSLAFVPLCSTGTVKNSADRHLRSFQVQNLTPWCFVICHLSSPQAYIPAVSQWRAINRV